MADATPDAYDPGAYGSTFSSVYDEWYQQDPTPAVTVITELAGQGGRVLELGAGTGRIALALAERGLAVTALDGSAEMLERLRAKPGGDDVAIVLADLTEPPEGPFDVVVVATNTLFNLATTERQRRCLAASGGVLARGGALVVEATVVDPDGPRTGLTTRHVTTTEVVLSAFDHDPAAATVTGQFVTLRHGAPVELRPWRIHYRSPAEIDADAGAVGLCLVDRWGGWDRSAWDGLSDHVSVYRQLDHDGKDLR